MTRATPELIEDPAHPFITIAAMAAGRVIGKEGKMPWHIPGELAWFKRATMGHTVVMGRKTFESVGKPLPGRTNVVVTRQERQWPGVTTVHGLEAVTPQRFPRKFFIAGGAEIYQAALPRCGQILLTEIKQTVEGDTFFPLFEKDFRLVAVLEENDEFRICDYRRALGP
jgi:dihydrofolate reductase